METACLAALPGDREYDVAARVADECCRRGSVPFVNLVAADDRIASYRHPLPTDARVRRALLVALTGRRHGLHASLAVVARHYADEGFPREWHQHHQGGLTGYVGREVFATPAAAHRLESAQVTAWNPSITRVKSEDTVLVTGAGPDVLTCTDSWPQTRLELGTGWMDRPSLLES